MSLFLFKKRINLDSKDVALLNLEKWAQKSLDKNDPEPAFLIGNAFNEPDNLNFPKNKPYDVCLQNFEKAVYWLEKAVEAGHADAMVLLGIKYVKGNAGVKKDKKKGIELLKRADSIGTIPPGMGSLTIKMINKAA